MGGAIWHAEAIGSSTPTPTSSSQVEITLKIVLPRAVAEWLTARALREHHPSLAALVQAVLEREGKG